MLGIHSLVMWQVPKTLELKLLGLIEKIKSYHRIIPQITL